MYGSGMQRATRTSDQVADSLAGWIQGARVYGERAGPSGHRSQLKRLYLHSSSSIIPDFDFAFPAQS